MSTCVLLTNNNGQRNYYRLYHIIWILNYTRLIRRFKDKYPKKFRSR